MNHYILTGKKSVSIAKGVTKEGIESEKLPISGEISQYEEKPNSDKGKVFNDLTDYLNFLYLNQKEYADSDEDYDYIYTDQLYSDSSDSEEYTLKDYLSILYPEEEYSY